MPYPVEVEKFVEKPYDVERIEYVDVEHIIQPKVEDKKSIVADLISSKINKLKEKKLSKW